MTLVFENVYFPQNPNSWLLRFLTQVQQNAKEKEKERKKTQYFNCG